MCSLGLYHCTIYVDRTTIRARVAYTYSFDILTVRIVKKATGQSWVVISCGSRSEAQSELGRTYGRCPISNLFLVSTYVSVMQRQAKLPEIFDQIAQFTPNLEFGSRTTPTQILKFRQILALWVLTFQNTPSPPKKFEI